MRNVVRRESPYKTVVEARALRASFRVAAERPHVTVRGSVRATLDHGAPRRRLRLGRRTVLATWRTAQVV